MFFNFFAFTLHFTPVLQDAEYPGDAGGPGDF